MREIYPFLNGDEGGMDGEAGDGKGEGAVGEEERETGSHIKLKIMIIQRGTNKMK